jgi:hypothetical protein
MAKVELEKLSEKGYEQRSEHGFGRYKEGEGAEESVLGGPQSCAIDASEAFRTVSEEGFSEVRMQDPRAATSLLAARGGSWSSDNV